MKDDERTENRFVGPRTTGALRRLSNEFGNVHGAEENGSADLVRDQRNNAIGRAAGQDVGGSCTSLVENNIATHNYAKVPTSP